EKNEVRDTQQHEHRWQNDHRNLRVFSTQCTNISPTTQINERQLPCMDCTSLLKLREFRNALRVAMPSNENYQHLNKEYHNEILGEQYAKVKGMSELLNATSSIFVNFAKGALQGKYDNHDVFLGLVKAMTQKINQDECGVGMQNFYYAPAWD
ncbi:hypothetical protein BDP27DRAFT_1142552, partial [Rhodocollybia butyracea]